MAYTCSYCKTGVMNTGEQYLTHINGSKHKKKAFQLQAPDDGIEYNEFKKKKPFKAETSYIENPEDFPDLPTNSNNVANSSNHVQYNNIKNSFNANSRPVVVYEGSPLREESSEDDEFITIDDVFFKPNSKIESARYIVNSYIKNQKTAAQALNEIAKAMLWELDFEPVSAINFRYGMAVLIDGIEFTIGEGDNKKEAKQNASAEAINAIKMKLKRPREETRPPVVDRPVEEPVVQVPTDLLADNYEQITRDKMREIERSSRRSFNIPKRYAAFIITERFDEQAREGTVVAFGAGKGMLDERSTDDTNYPGYKLKNFDSLVLARRSLQCFFYNQILLIFDKKKQQHKGEKVYMEIGKDGFVKFKHGCRLHLYLSHAPSGDCVTSLPSNWRDPVKLSPKEIERDKNGIMEPIMYTSYNQNTPLQNPGHIRVLNDNSQSDWISLVNYRLKNKFNRNITMSPTDKLMAWIHLGIQGAMLSHLMNPVYLYSIQFGKDYMHEHVSRALICRVPLENIVNNRGSYYDSVKYFDPYFERVSEIYDNNNYDDEELSVNSRVCINWYMNPVTDHSEVIDMKNGCVHPNSPFQLPGGEESNKCSRLSKVCMLIRLKETISAAINYFAMRPEFQRTRFLQGINEAAKYNYNSFKSSATDYRQLKQCLFESLTARHYGEWLPNVTASDFNLLEFYALK